MERKMSAFKPTSVLMGVLFLILVFTVSGCGNRGDGTITGLPYIMEHAGEAEAKSAKPEAAPAVKAPESAGEPTMPERTESGKVVYLTFDDGPDPVITPLILDVLDSYGVKGTFFVVGTKIQAAPEVLREISERGHAIGNHTYNHKYSEVYAGTDEFIQSFKTNEELIYRITGQRPDIVRDPGGEVRYDERVKEVLAGHGYRLINWNVDSYDSRKPNPDAHTILENVRQQAKNEKLWPAMIILMHDGGGHLNTVRALPTVIEMLRNQGFCFETVKSRS